MTYRIEISSQAEQEADQAFLKRIPIMGWDKARAWHTGLLQSIGSLVQMPGSISVRHQRLYTQAAKAPLR